MINVIGHMHEIADKRMPIVGGTAARALQKKWDSAIGFVPNASWSHDGEGIGKVIA
jgi:hypothetical protein